MLGHMAVSFSRCAMSTLGLCTLALLAAVQPVAAPAPQDPPAGHLVFVVEGDVNALRVTHAVAKPDPVGHAPKGLHSEFSVRALDASGAVLHERPLDLTKFDTDPTHVGGPDVVRGCEVLSPRIGTLVNVPALADAATWQFTRGDKVLGTLTKGELDRLVQEARR